ncbi:MAG: recombinase family protein [Robiginitomaculum sp.]|nr:MAG: recombinase family protein [Robiginitomaculum sp.]
MYVRMSTDHQKYSTENQADRIREYAKDKKLEIVETYADEGKSGLSLNGRDALKRLIHNVQDGHAKFSVILVLDITRWGRFQDSDESAYYEYICRNAGVNVHYVDEQFENDGSPSSDIIKSVKRAMAGEYSRELSKKVFAGQCRLIELGYRQGGPAGYGLRRLLIDESGNPKIELKRGEHKSFQTDRVILVPGPKDEVEVVQWMYKQFVEHGLYESEIASELNRKGILTDLGRAWTRTTVHQVLTNEKYIGNNVFNRTSNKLKKRHVKNSEDMWIRLERAFEAIVSSSIFYAVKAITQKRNRRFSNDELLDKLRDLRKRHGWLSGVVIDEQCDMPSSGVYQYRFGSLLRAYKLVGYTPSRDYRYIEINRHLRQLYSETIHQTIQKIRDLGASAQFDESSGILCVNNELRVSIVICRCFQTNAGSYRWKIRLDNGLEPDITIAIRMDAINKTVLDYYLLPSSHIETLNFRFSETNGLGLDAFRFDTLDTFFDLTQRISISEVA